MKPDVGTVACIAHTGEIAIVIPTTHENVLR